MSGERAGPGIRDVIAERVFQRPDGKDVRALVGRPREAEGEWVCEFQLLGIGQNEVYSLPGGDSLEALQLALGMMVVELESYQRDHGLTLMGDAYLGLMKPDFEAMLKEIEASPDYERVRPILDEWACRRDE